MFRLYEKQKIALEIEAKIASVNGPFLYKRHS
jgi:hypothetical protein